MVLPHIKKKVVISNNVRNIFKKKKKNAKRTHVLKETTNKQYRQTDIETPTPDQLEPQEKPRAINLQMKEMLLSHRLTERNELVIQQKESFNLYTNQYNEKQHLYYLHKKQHEDMITKQTHYLFLLKQIHKAEEDEMSSMYMLETSQPNPQVNQDQSDENTDQLENHQDRLSIEGI